MRERLNQKLNRWLESQALEQAREFRDNVLNGKGQFLGEGRDNPGLEEIVSFLKKETDPYQVILDFDGVLASPSHWILGAGERTVGFKRLRSLVRITEESEKTIVWTSRFSLPFFPAYFPFWRKGLWNKPEHKLLVETNKSLLHPEKRFRELVEESEFKTLHIFSSKKDRDMIKRFKKNNPELMDRIFFFDTCHLFL